MTTLNLDETVVALELEGIGYVDEQLVHCTADEVKPTTPAEALRVWARLEEEQDDGEVWDSPSRVKFLRLVAAQLDQRPA